jgi:hypothetical protein
MQRIEDYEFGSIKIDGREESKDVIVMPDRVVRNWWRKDGHELVLEDLLEVLDELPERLIVGTGAYGRMKPDPKTLAQLAERGVDVEALPTKEAVELYNRLDPARAAAALHLTC